MNVRDHRQMTRVRHHVPGRRHRPFGPAAVGWAFHLIGAAMAASAWAGPPGVASTAAAPSPMSATPSAPREQSSEERAQVLFAEATRHFQAGNDQQAIALLRQAHELSQNPSYLFNLGLVYHYGGDCPNAREAFERYLRADPDGVGREQARQALHSLYGVCGPADGDAVRARTPALAKIGRASCRERV